MGFLSKWLRGDEAHSQPGAAARANLKRRCRIEKLQDRRPMAADIHIGAVYYEDTTDGEDQTPDTIEIRWSGGPAGAELKSLTIDMDKNGNGILDPGETFFDTAGTNFGVGQFGNSDLQLIGNGFSILSANTLSGISGQWDGATSIVLTFNGFTNDKTLLIKVDVDEAGFFGSASAIVEGDEFQYSKMSASFSAPHYKDTSGTAVFLDAYSNAAADQVGLPRDDYNVPPGLPVPVRTAGAFINLQPEPYAAIRGNVHVDYNGDCLVDPGEPLLQGVTIQLLDAGGNVIATTLTDVNGNYEFLDLNAGTYSVREIQPAQYFSHAALAGTINGTKVGTGGTNDLITGIQLTAGAQAIDYNFCEGIGQISGRVHAENDGNGVYDPTDKLLQGVTIELLDSTGNVIGTTTTDANGEYLFDKLTIGTYSVRELQPTLYFDSVDKIGTVGGVTSGSITVNDRIDNIQLVAASKGIRYDFVEKYGSISGFVLADKNGDCIKQDDEIGIAGVRMDLLDTAGNIVATTYTDANGNYKFEGLTRGTYTVHEYQPKGYFDSGDHIGFINGVQTGYRAANDIIAGIDLLSAPDGIKYDFCENPPASLGGVVFQDGPTIVIADSTTTISDVVANISSIRDGKLTSDDIRLPGVTLRLFRADGQPIFDVDGKLVEYTTTGADGSYLFTGLRAGEYYVAEVQPGGYYDSIDTPGTTGGFTINPDTIAKINLGWGQFSQQNNFSEVLVTNVPFRVTVDNPPPPPTVLPPGATPPPVAPNPANVNYTSPQSPDYYDSGVVGYTWHLSVVNGGKPRTSRLTQSQMVASTREIEEIDAARPDWKTQTVKQGLFKLRTGEDDQPSVREIVFGVEKGIPVTGDFNGDGNTDVGVFKDGSWYVDLNGNGEWDAGDMWAKLGRRDDLPITGDWDGDGKVDIAIFGKAWPGDPRHIAFDPGLPSDENAKHEKVKNLPPLAGEATMGVRAMQVTSTGTVRSDLIDHVFLYGWGGDQPIAGDWTGEGQEMIGIFRNGAWKLDLTGDGKYTDEDRAFQMGQAGDKPVVGDFDGDTIADVGIYRDGLWHIDTNHDGVLDARDRAFSFGDANDKPVVGDWDGDGIDDPGLYRDIKNTAQR